MKLESFEGACVLFLRGDGAMELALLRHPKQKLSLR